nr:MAG TPA: hypothetical protein [Caudoviricetes sp.]
MQKNYRYGTKSYPELILLAYNLMNLTNID